MTGAVSLGDIPVELSGSAVIDLDANGDGTMIGLTPVTIKAVTSSAKSALQAFGYGLHDVKIGVNGEAAFSTEAYGLDIESTLGTARAFYSPTGGTSGSSVVGFPGATVNPFVGTDLEMDARSAHTVHVHAGLAGMLGMAQVSLDGTVDWTTGNFDLTQDAWADVNAGVGHAWAHETFHLSQYWGGATTMTVGLHLGFQLGTGGYDVHGDVYANLTVTGDGHGHTSVSGRGSLSGGYTFAGISSNVSLGGIHFDNHGCAFTLLGGVVGEHISW